MEPGYAVVIGGANIDITGKAIGNLAVNESNIGSVEITCGGVGRNICENLIRLGLKTEFITAFSNDYFGDILKRSCTEIGIGITHSYTGCDHPSGAYLSLVDKNGDLLSAVCDSTAITNIPFTFIDKETELINRAECILVDCNLSQEMLEYILCKFYNKNIIAECVSSAKAVKLKRCIKDVAIVKLNTQEFESLYDMPYDTKNAISMATKYDNSICVTEGSDGSTRYFKGKLIHVPAVETGDIVSVNGAGDAYAAGLVYGNVKGLSMLESMRFASVMSYMTLGKISAVNADINSDDVIAFSKSYYARRGYDDRLFKRS
ncbi:MAG: carbohydrate kinase family protein [Clostridia bacterium]